LKQFERNIIRTLTTGSKNHLKQIGVQSTLNKTRVGFGSKDKYMAKWYIQVGNDYDETFANA